MKVRSDTPSLIHAVREIAKWCDMQSANTSEDAEHWAHVARARALDEVAERMEEMRLTLMKFAAVEEVFLRASDANHVAIKAVTPEADDDDDQEIVVAGDQSGFAVLPRGAFRAAKSATLDTRPIPNSGTRS